MSTHTRRVRPSLVMALVKVAMIGAWRGRTFLDDDREFDDLADNVPNPPATQLPVAPSAAGSTLEQPAAHPGHSVAA